MKKLFFILIIIANYLPALAQSSPGNDSTRYIRYPYNYGTRQPRSWFDSALVIPRDTIYSKSGIAQKGNGLYLGDGKKWVLITPGGGGSGANLDSAITVANIHSDSIFNALNNKKVDSVWFKNGGETDTVYYSINGSVNQAGIIVKPLPGRISGAIVTWSGQGLTYNITPGLFMGFDGLIYTTPSYSVTLATADATNPRRDLIIATIYGRDSTITGIAALNPISPQFDPSSQFYLTEILLPAGATVAPGVTSSTIYNENAVGEFTGTSTISGIDFNDTSDPFNLTKDIKTTGWSNGNKITFISAAPISSNSANAVTLHIKLPSAVAKQSNITVRFFNGTAAVGNVVTLGTANGFNKNTVGSYQNVVLQTSVIGLIGSFDKMVFTFTGTNTGGFLLDWIQLQGGVATGGTPTNFLTNVYKRNDSTFQTINGVDYFISKDVKDTIKFNASQFLVTPSLIPGSNSDSVNSLGGSGGGTVTSASVVGANGFTGSVANATTTPAITLGTSIAGILKGSAGAITAATAGTDYTTIAQLGAKLDTAYKNNLALPLYQTIIDTTLRIDTVSATKAGVLKPGYITNSNDTLATKADVRAGGGGGSGTVTSVTGTANQITVTGTTAPVISLPSTITGLTSVTSTGFTGALTGNATTVTTNANLTGPITSVGNATSIASQTGTGTTFVMSASPTLTGTPTLPTGTIATTQTAGNNSTAIATTAFVTAASGDLLEVYTTGTTYTVANGVNIIYIDPTTVMASLTLTLPATPSTKNIIEIYFGGTITGGNSTVTNLTIAANTGQAILDAGGLNIGLVQSGESIIYRYRVSNSKWYKQ